MSKARKADPARAIITQIIAALSPATATLINAKYSDWASATFSGARHELEFSVTGPDAATITQRFVQTASDIDFTIGGHIVADIVATREVETQTLLVEVLSVEVD